MSRLITHSYYDDAYVMYVVVGHSSALRFVMSEYLSSEIERGLILFMLCLLAGVLFCFGIFSCIFEKRLQVRVTKPIQNLSMQIRNPKEFMAANQKPDNDFT